MTPPEKLAELTAEQRSKVDELLYGHSLLNDQTGRTCRICGCTDDDCTDCVKRIGEPCIWILPDLCSGCDLEWSITTNADIAFADMESQVGRIAIKVQKNGKPAWITDPSSQQIYARGYRAAVKLHFGPPINQGIPADWHSAHFAGDSRQAAQDVAQRWALEIVRRYQTW